MIETGPGSRGPVARFGQRHPVIVDVLIAASWLLLTLPTLALVGTGRVDPTPVALTVGIILVVAVVLAVLRRRHPTLAFVVIFIITIPMTFIDPSLVNLAEAFAVFAIAVYASVRRAWLAVALSASSTVSFAMLYLAVGFPTWFDPVAERLASTVLYTVTGLLVLLVGALWGQNAAGRKRYIDDLLEHARHLEHERDQQVQLAALAERSRIARDVHDIVAHSLSVIVRLADGAQAVLDREPQRARDAIAQLGGVARSSLTEMRRVIGVLESPQGTTPQSGVGFDDLPRLVEVYRGVGLPVELTVRGDTPPEAGVQMTVFRVVQEALTNALRHAQGPTEVAVLIESDRDVTAVVRNDGVASDGAEDSHVGRGIVGMRERAALYGGELAAGPDGPHAWSVRLVLPGAGA